MLLPLESCTGASASLLQPAMKAPLRTELGAYGEAALQDVLAHVISAKLQKQDELNLVPQSMSFIALDSSRSSARLSSKPHVP